jgi:hypothetical protein
MQCFPTFGKLVRGRDHEKDRFEGFGGLGWIDRAPQTTGDSYDSSGSSKESNVHRIEHVHLLITKLGNLSTKVLLLFVLQFVVACSCLLFACCFGDARMITRAYSH